MIGTESTRESPETAPTEAQPKARPEVQPEVQPKVQPEVQAEVQAGISQSEGNDLSSNPAPAEPSADVARQNVQSSTPAISQAEAEQAFGNVRQALMIEDPNKRAQAVGSEVEKVFDKISDSQPEMGTMKGPAVEAFKEFAKTNPEETAALLDSLQKMQAGPNNPQTQAQAQTQVAENMTKLVEKNPKAAVDMAIAAGKKNPETAAYANAADALRSIPILGSLVEAVLEKVTEHMVKDAGSQFKEAQKGVAGQMSGGQNVDPLSKLTPSQTPKNNDQSIMKNAGAGIG